MRTRRLMLERGEWAEGKCGQAMRRRQCLAILQGNDSMPDDLEEPQADTRSVGAASAGALAVGAFAVGVVSIGALAVGAVAIGRLAVGTFRIRSLEIDELIVRRLVVMEQAPQPETKRG